METQRKGGGKDEEGRLRKTVDLRSLFTFQNPYLPFEFILVPEVLSGPKWQLESHERGKKEKGGG